MTTTMRRLFEQLLSAFFLLTVVRRFKSRSSLLKIRAAQAYVLGVKKTRIFFLGALFVSISFVFLINGISLIQMAIFTYSKWSDEMKFVVAMVLGGIEFLLAMGIFIFLFREETWSKFYGIQKVIHLVIKDEDKSNDLTDQP
jgi:hypothetical protein